MKYKILSLMIITDLLLSPMVVSAQTSCPEGHQYNPSTNVCTLIPGYKPKTTEVPGAEDPTDCSKIEDQAEQTKCYKEDADKKLSESGLEASNPLSGSMLTAITAGISVGLGTLAFFGADTKQCKANSVRLIKIAAVTNGISEIATLLIYSSELSSLDSKYQSILNEAKTNDETDEDKNKKGVSAQDKAFEFVIEQEKTYKKIGTTKGIVYAATGALYGAAAVMGILEQLENTAAYTKEAAALATDQAAQAAVAPACATCGALVGCAACAAATTYAATTKLAYATAKANRVRTVNHNTCRSNDKEDEAIEDAEKKAQEELDAQIAKQTKEQAEQNITKEAQEKGKEIAETELKKAAENQTKTVAKDEGKKIAADKSKKIAEENAAKNAAGGMKVPVISLAAAVGLGFLVKTLLQPEKTNIPTTPESSYYHYPIKFDPFDLIINQKFGLTNYFWSSIFYKAVDLTYAGLLGGMEQKIRKLKTLLNNPITRATIAGAMTASHAALSSHAFKQVSNAQKRINYLQGVRDDLEDTAAPGIAPCTEADRGNALKPECYCYNPVGDNNEIRTESSICKKVWAENKNKKNKRKIVTSTPNENVKTNFCIGQGNTADFSCSCKAIGKCQQIPSNFALGGIGSNILTETINDANALMSGSFEGGELSALRSNQNALNLIKGANKLAKEKGLDKEMAPLKTRVDNMLNNHPTDVINAYRNASGMGGGAGGTDSLASLSPELKKDIEKKLGDEFKSIGGDISTSETTSAPDSGIDWGMDDEAITVDDATASLDTTDAMNAEYEMNVDTDISPAGSDTNIFDIVSLRYKRSGFRRIFGTKEEQQELDTAKKTDISQ